jgi:hypothetical protein
MASLTRTRRAVEYTDRPKRRCHRRRLDGDVNGTLWLHQTEPVRVAWARSPTNRNQLFLLIIMMLFLPIYLVEAYGALVAHAKLFHEKKECGNLGFHIHISRHRHLFRLCSRRPRIDKSHLSCLPLHRSEFVGNSNLRSTP